MFENAITSNNDEIQMTDDNSLDFYRSHESNPIMVVVKIPPANGNVISNFKENFHYLRVFGPGLSGGFVGEPALFYVDMENYKGFFFPI